MKVLLDRDLAQQPLREALARYEVAAVKQADRPQSIGGTQLLKLAREHGCSVVLTANLAAADEARKSLAVGERPRISFLTLGGAEMTEPENVRRALPEVASQIEDVSRSLARLSAIPPDVAR